MRWKTTPTFPGRDEPPWRRCVADGAALETLRPKAGSGDDSARIQAALDRVAEALEAERPIGSGVPCS